MMQKSRLCRSETVRTRQRYRRIRDSRKVVNAAVKRLKHGGAIDDLSAFRHPESDSDARAEPERSPSGVRTEQRTPKGARDSERTLRCRSGDRAEPEQRRGLRKEQRTPKENSDTGAETEWSSSGARMEKGLRKDAPVQEHSSAEPERSPNGERTPKGRTGAGA